jgi:CBS domain containing-hemolysin-like protein
MEELRQLGVHVDEEHFAEPVGAFVLSQLGRLPRKGDKVPLGGASAEITKVARRRVTQVRVRVPKTEATA